MVYYTCLWAVANTLVPWTFQPSVWPMHSTELLLHVISLFIQISPSVAISALLLGNRQCHTQPLPLNGQWYLVSIIKCDESSLRANWDSSFQMHPSLLWSIFHHNTFYNQLISNRVESHTEHVSIIDLLASTLGSSHSATVKQASWHSYKN